MHTKSLAKGNPTKDGLPFGNSLRHLCWQSGTILFILSFLLLGCSRQSAMPLRDIVTPLPPVAITLTPLATPITQLSSPTPVPTLTLLPSSTATLAFSPLEFVRRISGDPNPFSLPSTLAFDTKGDLYVMDAGNDRVQVFDPSGKFITMWGSQGSGQGQFDEVVHEDITYTLGGIAIDKDNNVFVSDAGNQRIQKFDSAGKFLLQWGSYGIADGQFIRPISLALDAQGYVYVVDDHRDDIQKFDSQGKYIKTISSQGTADGQLENTGSITIGPDGNLYIADYGNQRVEVFNLDGQYLRKWSTPYPKVDAIAFDRQGNSFTTHDNGAIVEYDSSGMKINLFNNFGPNTLGGIVIDTSGLIYVTDNNAIDVFKEK